MEDKLTTWRLSAERVGMVKPKKGHRWVGEKETMYMKHHEVKEADWLPTASFRTSDSPLPSSACKSLGPGHGSSSFGGDSG